MKFLAVASETRGAVGTTVPVTITEQYRGTNWLIFDAFSEGLAFNQNRQILDSFLDSAASNYFGGKVESPGDITIPADYNTTLTFIGACLGMLTETAIVSGTAEVGELYAVPIEENYEEFTSNTWSGNFPSMSVWVNTEEYLRKIAGMACNQITITAEQGSPCVMMTASLVGGNEILATRNVGTGAVTEGNLDRSNYYAFAHGTISIAKAGGSLTAYPTVTSFNATINRNLKTDPYMNEVRYVDTWVLGELVITGSVTAFIDDDTADFMFLYMDPSDDDVSSGITPEQYDATLANRFLAIEVVFDTGVSAHSGNWHNKGMFIYLPRCTITSATFNKSERGRTEITMEYQAKAFYNDQSYDTPAMDVIGNTISRIYDEGGGSFVGTYLPILIGWRDTAAIITQTDNMKFPGYF